MFHRMQLVDAVVVGRPHSPQAAVEVTRQRCTRDTCGGVVTGRERRRDVVEAGTGYCWSLSGARRVEIGYVVIAAHSIGQAVTEGLRREQPLE